MTKRQTNRKPADAQLDTILGRIKYVGPEPEPSEDAVMTMVLSELRTRLDRTGK